MLQVKKFTNVYVKNFGENQPEEKLEEVFSKFGIITSYKLVSIFHRFSPFFTEHVQVKDRNLSEKEDDDEGGVENSGDSKNKGFGFVSFQASKNFLLFNLLLCNSALSVTVVNIMSLTSPGQ